MTVRRDKNQLPVVLVEAVGVAKVAKVVVAPQVAEQLVVVDVALVAKVAQRVAAVRSVVRVALAPVQAQLLPRVVAPLPREDLPAKKIEKKDGKEKKSIRNGVDGPRRPSTDLQVVDAQIAEELLVLLAQVLLELAQVSEGRQVAAEAALVQQQLAKFVLHGLVVEDDAARPVHRLRVQPLRLERHHLCREEHLP